MTSRTIRDADDVLLLNAFLGNMPFPYTVDVTKGASRSKAQNKLQRVWCSLIAAALDNGNTAEEVRGETKLRIGVPIMRIASDTFCEKYDRLIKPLPYKDKVELMMEPMDFPVTRAMNTTQKIEYLDGMQKMWAERGVSVSYPGDWI
jgi:hypothetical protein